VCYATENVLPELDALNVEPVRSVIREAFVKHIVDAKGLDRARALIDDVVMPTPEAVMEAAKLLAANTPLLAGSREESRVDAVLASACADIAVERHVGHVKETYAATGPVQLLHGKDLRRVNTLIGVGGVFAFGAQPADILRAGLARPESPHSMRPEAPALLHDASYVFYAMGLLAAREPVIALRLLKAALVRHA
jgi:hypothetical protein